MRIKPLGLLHIAGVARFRDHQEMVRRQVVVAMEMVIR
jgi:hypothetical protein